MGHGGIYMCKGLTFYKVICKIDTKIESFAKRHIILRLGKNALQHNTFHTKRNHERETKLIGLIKIKNC